MKYKFSATIHKEEDWYVSCCPELDVASQGKTVEEALVNLREAVELYLEDKDVSIPQKTTFLTTTFEVSYDKTSRPVST